MGNRVALIADAGAYVGPHLARVLAARGHDLVLGDAPEELVAELTAAGAQVLGVPGVRDLSVEGAAATLASAALDRFGRIDAASAFSGRIAVGRFLRSTVEDLREVLTGCVEAPYQFLQAMVPPMIEGGGGQILVITSAAGARPTEGLTGAGWGATVHTFYDLTGALALQGALAGFGGGRLVVNVVDLPIKCPVAPLEFCFLADWYLRERGVRDRVQLTYATPLDGAFTKPTASRTLSGLLADKGVELVTEFNTGEVDGAGGRLVGYDGREVPFDLAVVVPLHGGAPYVARSPGLGDELGFVPTDPHTLQSLAAPEVFAIGDAANLPASKAGSVTHFEGEVLVENICRFLAGQALDATYDGHANCFIETGFHKAMLIDFNYETEPLPGHFPGPIGMPLLKESRLNHLGKLMFQWFYWHVLLPGRDIPGVGSDMPEAGKVAADDPALAGHR